MRIVSLSPSSTEILFAIGAGDEVVGVTYHCDYPAKALQRQRLGSWLHAQPKAIDALAPDFIITTTFRPEELRTYSGRGEVIHLEPTGLSSVLETILLLGRVTGRYQAAELLVQTMHQEFENIRASAPVNKIKVYCETWPSPPMHAGNWVPELIEIAGGTAVGGSHASPSSLVSVDALHNADPDLMVFHWCDQEKPFDIEQIRSRSGWSKLRALQANAYEYLPENLLNRPGPRLVDGVRQLHTIIRKHQRAK
jgi:iron complex transport system substrate-binding protein